MDPKDPITLISCPEKYIIGPKHAKSLFEPIWVKNPHIRQPLVKLSLLFEVLVQGNNSMWNEYLNTLPNIQEINLPTSWDSNELEWLKGTNLYGHVSVRNHQWQLEYNELKTCIDDFDWDLFSYEKYKWASSVFLSRAFPARVIYTEKDYGSDILNLSMLIPVLDSLNHKPQTSVYWTAKSDIFTFSIGYSVEENSEIFNNYGPKGNEELLMGYGFCIETHSFDLVTVKLNLPPVEGLVQELSRHEIEVSEGAVVSHLSLNTPLSIDLLKLFVILSRFEQNEEVSLEFSRSEKLKGVDALQRALSQKLDIAKNGEVFLTESQKNLMNTTSLSRYNYANIYRNGQKIILEKSLDACKNLHTDLLDNPRIRIEIDNLIKDVTYDTILREIFQEDDCFEDDDNAEMAVVFILAVEYLKKNASEINKELVSLWPIIDEKKFVDSDAYLEFEELKEWFSINRELDEDDTEGFREIYEIITSELWTPKILAESKKVVAKYGYWSTQGPSLQGAGDRFILLS